MLSVLILQSKEKAESGIHSLLFAKILPLVGMSSCFNVVAFLIVVQLQARIHQDILLIAACNTGSWLISLLTAWNTVVANFHLEVPLCLLFSDQFSPIHPATQFLGTCLSRLRSRVGEAASGPCQLWFTVIGQTAGTSSVDAWKQAVSGRMNASVLDPISPFSGVGKLHSPLGKSRGCVVLGKVEAKAVLPGCTGFS